MRRILLGCIVCFALSFPSLGAIAQQLKIESQGQAEQESLKAAAIAKDMEQSVGAPAAGMGQVVFYRSSKSPGEAIDVAADGASVGGLDAGMYFALPAAPGAHRYGPGELPISVKAGETKYVQVIRNRTGNPQLLASNAAKFQAAARQSK